LAGKIRLFAKILEELDKTEISTTIPRDSGDRYLTRIGGMRKRKLKGSFYIEWEKRILGET